MHLEKAVGIAGDSLTLLGAVVLAVDALTRPSRVHEKQAATKVSAIVRKEGAVQVNTDGSPVEVEPDVFEAREAARGRVIAVWGAIFVICGFAAQLASRLLGP